MEAQPESHDPSRVLVRYRNRDIRQADLELIQSKIGECGGRPGHRWRIATAICETWQWHQANGELARRACCDLLVRLAEWRRIELPPLKEHPDTPRRRSLPILPLDLIPLMGLEVRDPDANLDSLIVRPLLPEERFGWRVFMDRYHYLGYRPIVGEHVVHVAVLDGELVALIAWASAALNAPLRDAFIGWDDLTKRRRLHLVTNNVRFLVLPWVHVRHLASKVLAMSLRRLRSDWQAAWNHPVHLAETFVDTRRFRGTCYRASNWIELGMTAGRGKRSNTYLSHGVKKALYVYPLHRDARRLLRGQDTT